MNRTVCTGLRLAAALALLGALTGCHKGKVYPLSPAAARSALAAAAIPDMAFGKAAHSGPGTATAEGVEWPIVPGAEEDGVLAGDGGEGQVMTLKAKLEPASNGVEVTVDVAPPAGADPKLWAKATTQRPAMFHYFRTVAREQVDSVLTHRPFSFAAVSGDMAVAVVSSLPDIRKQLADSEAADDRRDQETLHRAYDLAEQGRH